MIQREESVVARRKCCGDPSCRRMTRGACCGPARRYVIGIRRSGEVGSVAGVTRRRGPREYVIDMAFHAIHGCVRAGQREGRVVVIECRSGPRTRRVTGVASRRETRRDVIRIGRAIPVGLVAPIACRGQRRVVVVCVALRTGNCGVCAGQRERCVVVIKR